MSTEVAEPLTDNYHDDFSCWSKTMVWSFEESREICYHTYITRKMPPKIVTVPALAGIVKHSIALDGCAVDDLVLTYPAECLNKNGGLIGKPAREFREANPDAVIVKQAERDELVALATSVLQTEELQGFIGKRAIIEERFDAIIDDVPCKCKPDIIREYDDYLDVFDLKFPLVLSRESFRRANKRFGYWFQREHYIAVLEQAFLKPVRNFVFLNIESNFPFRVKPKTFDRINTIPAAKKEHRKSLARLLECLNDPEKWKDDWPVEEVMSPWDFQHSDVDELVEVEQ